ncbi:hypothetical protein PTT_08871 [Pyrenophora teres f. teres 0-1]|uniref:Uncharacterized protein n=1 Tax=Pyrenophora teres f. teres (strain 0-1) TaxID=861557 RepID=E3RKT0_PYRTT|nr:hypothetical protein PTT_08871 [Pyrenophora teres f. teres 0-1]
MVSPQSGDTCDFIEATWGVDYWALLLVTKLRNASAWVHALSQPYRDRAQYHADKVWIIADWDPPKKGIWELGNITEELLRRRPDLAKHVSQHRTFAKRAINCAISLVEQTASWLTYTSSRDTVDYISLS